jgi:hypothetical protein
MHGTLSKYLTFAYVNPPPPAVLRFSRALPAAQLAMGIPNAIMVFGSPSSAEDGVIFALVFPELGILHLVIDIDTPSGFSAVVRRATAIGVVIWRRAVLDWAARAARSKVASGLGRRASG